MRSRGIISTRTTSFAALLAALTLALGLAACGDDEPQAASSQPAPTATAAPAADGLPAAVREYYGEEPAEPPHDDELAIDRGRVPQAAASPRAPPPARSSPSRARTSASACA